MYVHTIAFCTDIERLTIKGYRKKSVSQNYQAKENCTAIKKRLNKVYYKTNVVLEVRDVFPSDKILFQLKDIKV